MIQASRIRKSTHLQKKQVLPCTYCGGIGIPSKIIYRTGVSAGTKMLPPGVRIIKETTDIMGNTRYFWAKYAHVVNCLTDGCPNRNPSQFYRTRTLAVQAWNDNQRTIWEETGTA